MIFGIDISHWNKLLELDKPDFVIIKATEGVSFVDSKMLRNYKEVTEAGKIPGFYHFARPDKNSNPEREAQHFLNTIPKEAIGNCLLALDWEANALKCNIQWARKWLDYVFSKTGVRPLFYCQGSYTNKIQTILDGNYGLWVAHYKASTQGLAYGEKPKKGEKPTTGAYKTYAFWQFSSKNIYNCDCNVFNGTLNQLKKYCEVIK